MEKPNHQTAIQREPVPAHVPSDLVHDFDYVNDPEFKSDPHRRLGKIVSELPPIFYSPTNGGNWVITGQDLLFDAVRNPATFSSAPSPPPGMPLPPVLLPLMVDPPQHKLYRSPLNAAFNPKSMLKLEGDMRDLVREHIDMIIDDGGCEFVSAIAEPLPVSIFLRMMGLPEERAAEFREVVCQTQGGGAGGLARIAAIMEPFIQSRREEPTNDLMSRLWSLEIEGRPITVDEMRNYCMLLYVAGLDTVINAIAFAIRHLAADQDLQETLRADMSRIPVAVEEMLRRYGIVMPPRLVARDVEFGGAQLKRGDRVLLALPAGNLDEKAFADPMTFDLDRENLSHLTFNAGNHRCVGSHLARVELRVLYEEWLSAVPTFRLDPERPAKFRFSNIIAVDKLNLLWGPGR